MQNSNENPQHVINLAFRPQIDDLSHAIHHQLNIRRRTCTTFIPKTGGKNPPENPDEVQCGCKRLRREHSWDVNTDTTTTKWDKEKHTRAAYNNAFGQIPDSTSKYLRCDIKTEPRVLSKFMFDVWKIKEPQLIMCIIGGAKYFKLSERLEREFMKGTIRAALKANGWIVTTGFKTGVVQLVGEAIHDHKVTDRTSNIIAIGCSKWGAAKERHSLILNDHSKNKPTTEKGQQVLEPNHTHFLLLDDGTYYGYDAGDYRTRFVTEVSSYNNKDIPIVTIVVEGGPDTLLTMYRDLRSQIPIVLIDGSGRVPNLLANFLSRTESIINRIKKDDVEFNQKTELDIKDANHIEILKNRFRSYEEEIREGLREIAKGSQDGKQLNELYDVFLYCLQPAIRNRIQIFSLDGDYDLDDTIFQAIIQAKNQKSSNEKKSNKAQLLQLALAWDAIEIAKEHVIKDDLSDLDDKTRKELLLLALKQDRPQFVHTFLKLDFNLPSIFYRFGSDRKWSLNHNQLIELYNDEETRNSKNYYLFKHSLGSDQVDSVEDLDRVLRKLVGDYMKSIYTHVAEGALGKWQVCCQFSRGRVADSRAQLYRENDEALPLNEEDSKKEIAELVCRDLFFWSVLTNRIEMAKVLISHMETRICAALIASKIFKSYENFANNNESKDLLTAQANQFEEYANELLKCCYNYDEELACEIAIRRIYPFGSVSCLQVAVDADDKTFVGQPCCDQLLNNIWYDKIEPFATSKLEQVKFLLSIFSFGLLAPVLIKFRQREANSNETFTQKKPFEMTVNETEQDDEELKEKLFLQSRKRLQSRGINYSEIPIKQRKSSFQSQIFSYFRKLDYFHTSPYVKFSYNVISYIFFLLLFSYYLLFDFRPPTEDIPSIHWTEILVIIIITTMLFEDIRKFLCQENRSLYGKFSNYFIKNAFFSLMRIGSYLLFYIGLIFRFELASTDEDLSVAKIILAYDLEIWFIRSLTFLGIAKKMGPKLVMIRRMLVDLAFFIYIILIAMIGYGVASRAMYNFNSDEDSDDLTFDGRSVFRHIIYPVYYLMYGSQDDELAALDRNPNMATSIATQVLLAFHMLFVNILLVNLLIAMFSFTFESVQTQTDLVWRYERYLLVRDYFDRPPLFPPFIIFTHIIEIIKLIGRHLLNRIAKSSNRRKAKTFKMISFHRRIDKQWSEFESYATNLYIRSIIAGQPASAATLVPSIAHQQASQANFDTNNLSPLSMNSDMKTITDELTLIKRTIGELRTQSEEMNRCMQWMMDAMERVRMSREPKPRLRSAFTTNEFSRPDE